MIHWSNLGKKRLAEKFKYTVVVAMHYFGFKYWAFNVR